MTLFIPIYKLKVIKNIAYILIAIVFFITAYNFSNTPATVFADEQIPQIIHTLFATRNAAILKQDSKTIEQLYDTGITLGKWAYEHQIKKLKYLHIWSDKQGVKFIDISSKITINRITEKESEFTATLAVTTQYDYVYENEPEIVNSFKLGTYHSLQVKNKHESWLVTREWFTDPFADSLSLDDIKSEEVRSFILNSAPRDSSLLNDRRVSAVQYADKYCGLSSNGGHDFVYNKKYKNYNYLGGDCANFVSQVLYEGGKFKKTAVWNYNNKGGSAAWLNANALKNYMLNSGRASLIAQGSYLAVYKVSNRLEPGDIVAYEKKGKVAHVSIVTGADSKGYALVSCHNADRYKVPWDLGWSDKGIKFWLIRVHY